MRIWEIWESGFNFFLAHVPFSGEQKLDLKNKYILKVWQTASRGCGGAGERTCRRSWSASAGRRTQTLDPWRHKAQTVTVWLENVPRLTLLTLFTFCRPWRSASWRPWGSGPGSTPGWTPRCCPCPPAGRLEAEPWASPPLQTAAPPGPAEGSRHPLHVEASATTAVYHHYLSNALKEVFFTSLRQRRRRFWDEGSQLDKHQINTKQNPNQDKRSEVENLGFNPTIFSFNSINFQLLTRYENSALVE